MGTRGLPSHDRLLSTIGRELAIKIVNVRLVNKAAAEQGRTWPLIGPCYLERRRPRRPHSKRGLRNIPRR